MSQVQSDAQSRPLSHFEPGICGVLACPRICSRVCHCPAGQRRSHALLAAQARRRFTVSANRQQEAVCVQIHKADLCPSLCTKVGGCFLPQYLDSTAELKRKCHRSQKAMDFLVTLRQRGRPAPPTPLSPSDKLLYLDQVKTMVRGTLAALDEEVVDD